MIKSPAMTQLCKSFLSIIEYCSVLASPLNRKQKARIEALQRKFTTKIKETQVLDYWERLAKLQFCWRKRRIDVTHFEALKMFEGIMLSTIVQVSISNKSIIKVYTLQYIERFKEQNF